MASSNAHTSQRPTTRAAAIALLAMGFWWILSEGDRSGLGFGLIAALAAAWASWRFPTGSMAVSPSALLRLVPFFIGASLRGGWDVALRAFGVGRPLAPALVWHATRLPPGGPRVLLANCISLLPGTLTAAIEDDAVLVHVLDRHSDYAGELRHLERQVARVYRIALENPRG